MTNTLYFDGIVRDDASTTSSSDVSLQQLPSTGQASSSSSLYKVIGKAITVLIPRRSGLNTKESINDGKEYESNGKFSSASLPGPWSGSENVVSGDMKVFNFNELKIATRNFHPDVLLGQGGFGQVFKGWIDPNTLTASKPGKGIAVAVKSMNSEGFQGHEEWLAEVRYLGWLNHPNLVILCGYCLDNEKRLLVYEYMPKGSLDNHLFRRGSPCIFSWSLRMKITLGAAKGLAFLHKADINIIHRGFQCSNILLDSNYNAKLSDFGLARDGPTDGMSHVSTRVVGTYGIIAPEYVATGHLTSKSDVYSFGVVLLEILSGRRAMDLNQPLGEHNLVDWAKSYLSQKRRIFHILDSHLKGQCTLGNAEKAANLIFRCLANDPKTRPNMDEVVAIMEQMQDSQDTEYDTEHNSNNQTYFDTSMKI